jgi:cytoskeletal protein CcmA (bactofilin family)
MFFKRRPKLSPLSASSAGIRSAAGPSSASVIGRNTRFRGEVRGKGPLSIRGQVKGAVAIDERLSVEQDGILEADVIATDIVVAGHIQGDLRTPGTAFIRSSGRVEGSLRASRLRVDLGAVLKGSISRSESVA